MKKAILMLFCTWALVSVPAHAQGMYQEQPVRHYVSFSIGDNLFNALYGGYSYIGYYEPTSSRTNWFAPDVYSKYDLFLPTFSFSYYYAFKPWLLVGGELYYCGEYSPVYEKPQMQKIGNAGTTAISILPSIRFQYFNRKYCGLYSGLSLGWFIGIDNGYDLYTGIPQDAAGIYSRISFQITAFGVRFGDKIYGTAEIGCGVKGIATIGIGTRF